MATLTHPRFASGTVIPIEPARRVRAKRGDGERLRHEILDAVDTLLAKGAKDDAVSIRNVAELVGCTPPAIYLHFFDKQELLFEVCARRFAQLNAYIDEATAGVGDPMDAVVAGARAYLAFGLDHPEHYRFLFMGRSVLSPEQIDELRATGVTGTDRLRERCQRCIDAGLVRIDDASLMGLGIWALVHGVVSLLIAKPHVDWPDPNNMLDHLLISHLNGLRA